jgi:ubiquinol-cytochrome c reductase iron-sulfur subunit
MASSSIPAGAHGDPNRRDFLMVASGAMAAVGAIATAWPFINNLNPAADTLALSSIEVNVKAIAVGQAITVKWRGKPVFIRHRTPEEIKEAEAVKLDDLPDPQTDDSRVIDTAKKVRREWLIVVGVCTHLGCVPLGTKQGDPRGEYGGWFCPCHGSQYDSSGRIRQGPAPKNLALPPYKFLSDSKIRIGEEDTAKV